MNLLIRLGLLAVLALASSKAAARPLPVSDPRCAFDVYTPLAVMPYAVEEDYGYGVSQRIQGVRVFVAAKPGLTERGLLIRLHREVAQSPSSAIAEHCRPDVRDLQVAVFAGEGGFWVELGAPDKRSAASVLRWAERGLPEPQFTAAASR